MINKTDVLSFDIDKYNSRECQVHNHGFYLGEQSKQAEFDELHVANVNLMRIKEKLIERNEDMFKQILKRENCNRQLKSKIDDLNKRIDKAVDHIEEWYGVVELSMIVDILKGDKS